MTLPDLIFEVLTKFNAGTIAVTADISDDATRDLGKVDIADIDGFDSVKGQTTMAESLPVVLASDHLGIVVDATGAGDVPITLDSEVVAVDATGQGDVPVTLDGETVELAASTAAIGKLAANSGVDIGDVDVTSISAGENHIGEVGSAQMLIPVTPTVTAGAYAAGDAVGGLLTFANAARVSTGGGVIKNMLIWDDAGQDGEMELWLFNQTFTAMADNDPWDPSQADLRNLVAIITTADGAWFSAGTESVARVEASQEYNLAGTSMFGQLVTRTIITPTATDDISVGVGLLQG